MRILFINTPSFATRPISRSMAGGLGFDGHETMLLPPLDLALMAATLRNARETVEIIDADALGLDKEGVFHRIAGQSWDVILGTASLATIHDDALFLAELRHAYPEAKIVGKTLVRDHEVLRVYLQTSGADFIIHGEADLNILQLLQGQCRDGTAWLETQNASPTLVFRFEEGTPVPNLDELPFAAYDLLPYSEYRYPLLGAPVATLQTSRGCPFPCGYYCPYPLVEGVKWRAQSPERIFRELKKVVEGLGVKKVYFRDATFTLNQRRIHKLCEMIIQEKLRFEWVCETRVDCLSDDLLEMMNAAGCLGLLIGVETGDERIMHEKEGKKGLTLPKLAHVREKTLQLGMRLHFLLIVGLPQETRESLVSTYDLIFRYEPDTVGITLITPYPGTPLFKEGIREGWIESLQWEKYGGHQIVMHTPHLSAEEIVQGKRFLDEGVAILHKRRMDKNSPELDAYSSQHYEDLLRWAYGLDGPIAQIHSKVLPGNSREVSEPTTDFSSSTRSHGDDRSTISHPFISVVIPTFNRKTILRKTLLGLASQTLASEKFEVVVVDDGSSDDTMEMLQKWKTPFLLRVFSQTHGGPNVARNLGLTQAKGWIVLFTGDDMIPGPSFLEAHLKFHLKHRDSLQGMIGFIDWSPEISITPFMRFLTNPEGGHQFSFHLVKDGKADFRLFYTSNLSLKRELLTREPGPFDIDFTYPAYDDIELGFRLAKRGMQLYFNPQAVTYHHHEIRLTSYVERQMKAGGMAWILSQKQPQITQFLPLKELTEPNVPIEEELNKLLEIALELEKPAPEKLSHLSINGLPFDQVYARNILFPVYSKLLYSAQCFGAKQASQSVGAAKVRCSSTVEKPVGEVELLSTPVMGGNAHERSYISGEKSKTQFLTKIIAIPNDPICGIIRLINPLVACRQRYKVDGEIIGEGKLLRENLTVPTGPSVIWLLQRTCQLQEKVVNEALRAGTRIIHDVDDLLWEIPPDNVNKRVIGPGLVAYLMKLLRMVSCVTVSTEPLQQALEALGISSTILPNVLVADEWVGLETRRGVTKRPRIGWAGQARVHREDIAIIVSLIEALGNEVEWVFLGEAPQAAMSPFVMSEFHSMVPLADYPEKLASLNLDLALAPLVPNKFNEAKSDIRILQYGVLGYPVIGTDIFPHRDAPICRVPHEPQAWVKAIRERIHDREALGKEGNRLRQWVLANRLLDHVLPSYERSWFGDSPIPIRNAPTGKEQSTDSPVHSPSVNKAVCFDCSIIIPVFNKVDLTRQCLTRLAEVTEGCSFEVIVVDNASTDGTPEFLAGLEGDIQVITNPKNYGFARACNQGAKAAKGQYLVFLNNDTIPKAGWIQPLVAEVQGNSDVAVVGSKLLYPNETIQHAGVVFSKKCLTPYHIFRGAPGDIKAVNMRREFQVVTAACMLVRREMFDEVGGFDEIYQNGFEDVDLCLKVGKAGKKIIYQPLSVLYHLEHQTPGRKNPETEKHNSKILMQRWASSLVVDEDLYTVPEGYANRYYFRDGWLRQLLEPFRDQAERVQWEKVQQVQELLFRQKIQSERWSETDQSALRLILTTVEEWPQEMEILRWGATVCRSLNLYDCEEKFLERLLTTGEDYEGRENLAKALLAKGDAEKASNHIQILLSLDANRPSGHLLNGVLHMQNRRYADAVQCFQNALAGGEDSGKGRRGLGMAFLGMGSLDLAWETFKRAGQDQPDDPEILKHLLQTGTAQEKWEELTGILNRYLARNPADCDMRFALAGVLFRAGKIADAHHHCGILKLLSPEFEGLKELQDVLEHSHQKVYALAE